MKTIYLAFQGHTRRTICGFFSDDDMANFARRVPVDVFDKLPTVNALHKPIMIFDSVEEAFRYFDLPQVP